MTRLVRILYVDDYPLDRELVRDALEKEHGGFEVVEAASRTDFEATLAQGNFDLVLSDFNILGFEGLQVLEAVRATGANLPVIIVTGTGSEEIAAEAIKRGAADYVIKTPHHIRRLPYTIHAVLEKKRLAEERRQMEEVLAANQRLLQDITDNSRSLIYVLNAVGRFLLINRSLEMVFGVPRETLIAKTREAILPPEIAAAHRANDLQVIAERKSITFEEENEEPDGKHIYLSVKFPLLDSNGDVYGIAGISTDITERKRTEAALRLQSAALNAAANAIVIMDGAGLIQWVNPAFCNLTGYTAAEAIGKNSQDLTRSGQHDQAFYEDMWRSILAGQVWRGEIINRHKDGSLYTEDETITPVCDAQGEISHFIAIKQDVTARKALEAENKKLVDQFYQAQKMDTIGQLAGGIAHDFNNLLVPVIGYAELGMIATSPGSKLYTHFEQIKGAGDRAASLTRQILAFSRRQVLEMTIVDLNQVIGEFEKMLRRLLGEDIILKTCLAADLPAIKADKGQLEQVLLNLAVNARDAMPNGGQLTLETAKVMLDQAYVAKHVGTQPGPYVQLSVSDTGHGMNAATRQRIFEPFFTTKPREHGTGLGLSTVFGIVNQHGGNIWVYSEPGRGTTFKVFLPVAEALTPTVQPDPPVNWVLQGTETILVVEDETDVRQLVSSALRGYGYQVIETGDPRQGLELANAYRGSIHLLLTDVIMPVMNGRELFRQMVVNWPELKVLYMSGYTDNAIAHHGVLDEGVAFLQKPFTINYLLQKVRLALQG